MAEGLVNITSNDNMMCVDCKRGLQQAVFTQEHEKMYKNVYNGRSKHRRSMYSYKKKNNIKRGRKAFRTNYEPEVQPEIGGTYLVHVESKKVLVQKFLAGAHILFTGIDDDVVVDFIYGYIRPTHCPYVYSLTKKLLYKK